MVILNVSLCAQRFDLSENEHLLVEYFDCSVSIDDEVTMNTDKTNVDANQPTLADYHRFPMQLRMNTDPPCSMRIEQDRRHSKEDRLDH